MNTVDSLKEIIKIQTELGYDFAAYLNNPSTKEELNKVLQRTGMKFNEDLANLYSYANGCSVPPIVPSGKACLIPSYRFLNIDDALSYYEEVIEADYLFIMNDGKTPGKFLFPILDDEAGNCFWVDLNGKGINSGRIFWTNTFGDLPDYLFGSLENLFNAIRECYIEGYITVNEDGFLILDWKKWGEVAGKLNPDIIYWQSYEV